MNSLDPPSVTFAFVIIKPALPVPLPLIVTPVPLYSSCLLFFGTCMFTFRGSNEYDDSQCQSLQVKKEKHSLTGAVR